MRVELAAALESIVDERGSPRKQLTALEAPILQPTDERRRTGSHYTPRELTEPIVRHALEPAFERLGPDASPEQILDLKVCDPAMGSGAFLVEACRAIAAKLVDAWSRPGEKKPTIPPDEDEEPHARRLVAQRCLYGVDKNPLATDLAKLSLWLATLARDHEFTFLDHALKSGDTLVGLTQAQIAAAHWDVSKPGLPLFRQLVKERITEAMKGRAEIQAAPDDTARAIQEARHRSLEARLKDIRLIGDAVIGAFFAEDKPKAREKKRSEVESWIGGSPVAWDKLGALVATLRQGVHRITPFHWEIEFPEVFVRENGKFDAIVGNPPFLGGTWITGRFGNSYFAWLKEAYLGAGNRADLVSYFFRQGFNLLNACGCAGLIATNTIRQGDTRESGLHFIRKKGGLIYRAVTRYPWPGDAAVIVSIIHLSKTRVASATLNGRSVDSINSFLVVSNVDENPNHLTANKGRVFKGVDVYSMGFTFDDESARGAASGLERMRDIITQCPRCAERVQAYIGGEEINSDPQQRPHRFAINLSDLDEEDARNRFPLLMDVVEEKVRPERQNLRDTLDGARLKKQWWKFNRSRPELFRAIGNSEWVLACSQVSGHLQIARLRSNMLFANYVIVFVFSDHGSLAALQGRVHEVWVRFFASSMKDDLRYTPSDCFETFPLPVGFETSAALGAAGRAYNDHRAALMVARIEGMTKTYNRFHDRSESAEDIERLRELHAAVDRAVLESYGWHDLAARAEAVFLDDTNEDDHTYQGRLFWPSEFRDEVLARLLALNAERHAEEVRLGLASGMKGEERDADEAEEDM